MKRPLRRSLVAVAARSALVALGVAVLRRRPVGPRPTTESIFLADVRKQLGLEPVLNAELVALRDGIVAGRLDATALDRRTAALARGMEQEAVRLEGDQAGLMARIRLRRS